MSVYFVADGEKFRDWLLTQCPLAYRRRLGFLLTTIHNVRTGYIRGQMLLSLLVATLVGAGMWLLGVPHPLFLAAVAFVFECVPVVGFWIMGAVCVILALTLSWTAALLALGYFVIASNIEANVAAPRILGRAVHVQVHVHPVVSLLALLAGAEAFCLCGALFAAPAIGVAQALLGAEWTGWRETHPREFPEVATALGSPAVDGDDTQWAGSSSSPPTAGQGDVQSPAPDSCEPGVLSLSQRVSAT